MCAGPDLPQNYEWVVLDNGSDRIETREVLKRLAHRRSVRLYRTDENLGIIAGTRFCLERATGRYAATVDHDDLIAPDCVRVVTHALVAAGYPALAYSDEDKVHEQTFRDPYFKPDWDPVLFATSCYIAHLIVFDRQQALALGAYTDRATEGSHKLGHVPALHARAVRAGAHPRSAVHLADARRPDSWQHSVEAICRFVAPAGSGEVRGGGGTAGLVSNRGEPPVRWHA